MDVMNQKILGVAFAALLAATASAQAQEFNGAIRYGAGLKEYVPAPVPAPIPVPMAMPVSEGFTYYLRADLGWSFSKEASFSESGNLFGSGTDAPFTAAAPFAFGAASGFTSNTTSVDDVLTGTIGAGVYLSPRFRSDLTLDFRGKQNLESNATYSYASTTGAAGTITGTTADSLKVSSMVGLVNLYWDLLPRGTFSPYIGGGIGFVYNDIDWTHLGTEVSTSGAARTITGSGKDTKFGLAAALTAGVTFAFSHQWALDVNYRALYLDGGEVAMNFSTGESSKASLDDHWEHQVRVGLRMNIW